MEMNSPVGPNALDAEGVVGKPLDRVDGRLKVTGARAMPMRRSRTHCTALSSKHRSEKERSDRSISVLRRRRRASCWSSPIATRPRKAAAITGEAHPVLTGPEVDALRPAGCLRGGGKL